MATNLPEKTISWRVRLRAWLIRLNAFMEKFIQEADARTGH